MPFKYSLNWFSNQYLAPSCCSLLAVVVLAAFMFAGVVVVVLAPSTGLNMAAGGSAMANGTFSEKVLRDKTYTIRHQGSFKKIYLKYMYTFVQYKQEAQHLKVKTHKK